MDDIAAGRLVRLARQRRNWRQLDLAAAAGVSQQLVAVVEAGAFDRLTVRALRRVAASVDVRLPFAPRWRGGEADRVRDRDHAAMVEAVVVVLQRLAWKVDVEHTFSRYGERGSIDVLGWHAATSTLLVVEVKTRIYDVQALLAGLDRKARLAPGLIAADRGWRSRSVGRLVVAPELTATRGLVRRHAALFGATLPARGREVRAWLRRPSGPLAGLWLVSFTTRGGGIRTTVGRQRVRRRREAHPKPLAPPTTSGGGE